MDKSNIISMERVAVTNAERCVVCPRVGEHQEERTLAFEGAGLLHASLCLAVSLQFERRQGIVMVRVSSGQHEEK